MQNAKFFGIIKQGWKTKNSSSNIILWYTVHASNRFRATIRPTPRLTYTGRRAYSIASVTLWFSKRKQLLPWLYEYNTFTVQDDLYDQALFIFLWGAIWRKWGNQLFDGFFHGFIWSSAPLLFFRIFFSSKWQLISERTVLLSPFPFTTWRSASLVEQCRRPRWCVVAGDILDEQRFCSDIPLLHSPSLWDGKIRIFLFFYQQ